MISLLLNKIMSIIIISTQPINHQIESESWYRNMKVKKVVQWKKETFNPCAMYSARSYLRRQTNEFFTHWRNSISNLLKLVICSYRLRFYSHSNNIFWTNYVRAISKLFIHSFMCYSYEWWKMNHAFVFIPSTSFSFRNCHLLYVLPFSMTWSVDIGQSVHRAFHIKIQCFHPYL